MTSFESVKCGQWACTLMDGSCDSNRWDRETAALFLHVFTPVSRADRRDTWTGKVCNAKKSSDARCVCLCVCVCRCLGECVYMSIVVWNVTVETLSYDSDSDCLVGRLGVCTCRGNFSFLRFMFMHTIHNWDLFHFCLWTITTLFVYISRV